MSFIHIRSLLKNSLSRAGIAEPAQASLVVHQAQRILDKFFSDEPRFTRPLVKTLHDGLLTIACTSSVQAAALRLREREILSMLEEQFGRGKVESLRFIS